MAILSSKGPIVLGGLEPHKLGDSKSSEKPFTIQLSSNREDSPRAAAEQLLSATYKRKGEEVAPSIRDALARLQTDIKAAETWDKSKHLKDFRNVEKYLNSWPVSKDAAGNQQFLHFSLVLGGAFVIERTTTPQTLSNAQVNTFLRAFGGRLGEEGYVFRQKKVAATLNEAAAQEKIRENSLSKFPKVETKIQHSPALRIGVDAYYSSGDLTGLLKSEWSIGGKFPKVTHENKAIELDSKSGWVNSKNISELKDNFLGLFAGSISNRGLTKSQKSGLDHALPFGLVAIEFEEKAASKWKMLTGKEDPCCQVSISIMPPSRLASLGPKYQPSESENASFFGTISVKLTAKELEKIKEGLSSPLTSAAALRGLFDDAAPKGSSAAVVAIRDSFFTPLQSGVYDPTRETKLWCHLTSAQKRDIFQEFLVVVADQDKKWHLQVKAKIDELLPARAA